MKVDTLESVALALELLNSYPNHGYGLVDAKDILQEILDNAPTTTTHTTHNEKE